MFPLRFLLFTLFLAVSTLAAEAGVTLISVPTPHSSLTLCVEGDGRLYQLGYGKTPANLAPPKKNPAREAEFLPAYGNGFVLEPAIQATHADGNTSTDLIYVQHEATIVDTNVTLTRIELKDRFYPFFVNIYLKTYANEDVIEEWTDIRHDEDGSVTLYRFASSSPLVKGKEYWLTQFHGDWSREGEISEERLTPGIKILDSKLGVRASQYRIPSFILALNGPAKEETGDVLGGSLEWSGSYQLAFDVDWNDHLRVLSGINPYGSQYHLSRGRTFTTPAMLWTWSGHGKGQVSRNFHAWARRYGIRDGNKPRPVLLNNWEATYFNFNEQKLVSLLDGAKELGFELFLLDDGWFGNKYPRNNDNAGLGDWQANTNKLPHGLGYLAGEATQRGLRFGIWLEPEMVNPKSELYEKHPDWAIGQPHREPELSRHQLDLDLSNPAVKEFSWKSIDDTLGPNPGITYVKWDANRYVTQPGSTYLKPDEQSDLLIDYNFALYDIMARMAEKYPRVMAMLCSGGSGRADYGAMKYFDSFWPSDNTDPAKRVFIQWGFSHIFPACAMCAHVTRSGGRPLKFTLDVAMSEDLGFDVDLAKTTPSDRQAMASAIQLYKKDLREIIGQGDLYRLESPYDGPRACLDYVSPDRTSAVLFVYQLKAVEAAAVKPQGLDPHCYYTINEVNLPEGAPSQMPANGQTIDGATLMREGLVPPCKNQFDSAIIELSFAKIK
jgi:alpha-galactosidase